MAFDIGIAEWCAGGLSRAPWRAPETGHIALSRIWGGEDSALIDTDAADIAAARNGDHDAYGRLVTRYQNVIGAYMWRFTRDRGQWTELAHDVFVEAYFSLSGFRGDAPFLHWLRKIATRVGYRFWKQRARERERRELAAQQAPRALTSGRDSGDTDCAEALHAALAELPPRDRLVLTLLHLEELSTKEIARVTGWSHAMVRVQAFRARAKLKAALTRRAGYDVS